MSERNRNCRYSRLLAIAIAIILVIACASVPSEAKSPKVKKMTTYWSCLKSGNTVYCISNNHRIFKINLRTGKVKKLVTARCYVDTLALKGNYLYYRDHGGSMTKTSCLYRVNVKTGKKKKLASWASSEYVISGSKIYYKKGSWKNGELKYKKRVMKLNGKGKKATKAKIKVTSHESNASGYYIWNDVDWEYPDRNYHFYLETPDGSILLETAHPYY